MRLLFILFFISCFGFSQTNEVLVNEAIKTVKSENITTKSQAIKALESRGITESQARQLATQRGVSYDQLMNEYFIEDSSTDIKSDPDASILEEAATKDDEDLVDEDSDDTTDYMHIPDFIDYFGYNIFKNNPYLNKEYLLGNIDEGYLISPGDEIRIITYGDNSLEVVVTVGRNGNINIRDYGLFFASGMSFKTLKSRLKIFLGKYLSGLVSNPQKTFMDVALTKLTPTKVVVLGQVESPGPHILTTSGSALAALYAAGGVKYSGSLREIIIYRNNKLFKKIDLYDYITTGELRDDVRLTNNDIVFVPNRKNSIEVKGELRNTAAIYEILEDEDLTTLVKYSGGLLPTTLTNKVNIQRIIPSEERTSDNIVDRKLITIDYQRLINNNEKISLLDGDQVIFFRILDLESDQVSISGHVFQPGTYSLQTFTTLKSLIFDAAKGFMPDVYLEKVDVYSLVNGVETLNSYDLTKIVNDPNNINLLDGDRVIIYNNVEVEGDKTVSLNGYGGEIYHSTQWKENYSIYDLIFSSAGIKSPSFKENLLKSRIDLKRYNTETGNYYTIYYDFANPERLKEAFLLPKDRVVLYNKNVSENTDKKLSIYGYVKTPTTTPLEDEMYVEDLILLAGGYQQAADQTYVDVSRYEINHNEDRVTRNYRIVVDKDYLLGKKSKPKNNFQLQDKDIVIVPMILGYKGRENIKVSGEVNFPTNVVLEFKNSNFQDIINKAGGLTKYSNIDGSYLYRNGKLITLDFSTLNKNDNIFIDGDEIFIGSNKGEVITIGAVENESNFIWKKNTRAKNYIRNSGGRVKGAEKKSYVIQSNGKTQKINLFRNPIIYPNSTIVTNMKEEKAGDEKINEFLNRFQTTFALLISTLTSILLVDRL